MTIGNTVNTIGLLCDLVGLIMLYNKVISQNKIEPLRKNLLGEIDDTPPTPQDIYRYLQENINDEIDRINRANDKLYCR